MNEGKGLIKVTDEEYFQAGKMGEYLHSTQLKIFAECPAKYKYYLDNPAPESEAMNFGRAFHMAILEPHTFAELYLNDLARPQKENGDFERRNSKVYKEWLAEYGQGMTIIKGEDFNQIKYMSGAIEAHPHPIFYLGDLFEQVARAKVRGVNCQVKLDVYNPNLNLITDLKTTSNIENVLDRYGDINKYKYLWSSAFYCLVTKEALQLHNLPGFRLVFVEKAPPYRVRIIEINGEALKFYIDLITNHIDNFFNAKLENEYTKGYTDLEFRKLEPWEAKK